MLSDDDKRKTYDVFGDVDGMHAEFEEFFNEHFVDILGNMFEFSMPKSTKGSSRRPKPMARSNNMKKAMGGIDRLISQMMSEDLINSEDEPGRRGSKGAQKRPGSDDEWEDID